MRMGYRHFYNVLILYNLSLIHVFTLERKWRSPLYTIYTRARTHRRTQTHHRGQTLMTLPFLSRSRPTRKPWPRGRGEQESGVEVRDVEAVEAEGLDRITQTRSRGPSTRGKDAALGFGNGLESSLGAHTRIVAAPIPQIPPNYAPRSPTLG